MTRARRELVSPETRRTTTASAAASVGFPCGEDHLTGKNYERLFLATPFGSATDCATRIEDGSQICFPFGLAQPSH